MKIVTFLFALFPLFAFAESDTAKIVVPEGTEIACRLLTELKGNEATIGQNVAFELDKDIIINDAVAIPKGAKINGTVIDAAGSKALGKKGKLDFTIDYLYLNSGKVAKLRSSVKANTHGNGGWVAAGAILVTPLALFIKGKQAKFAPGTIFKAYIDHDITL